MENISTPIVPGRTLVTFRCAACKVAQGADLVALSRKGSATCTACHRKLSLQDVSRAIERERRAPGAADPDARARNRLWA